MKVSSQDAGIISRVSSSLKWLATLTVSASLWAEVPPITWEADFGQEPSGWKSHGDASLFEWSSEGLITTWDSSKPNSYFYLPLGVTLTTKDDFEVVLSFTLEDIQIGTTPGKTDTFQIALGLQHMESARNPGFYRGSGINPEHGPRNLLELSYFPDSGWGETLAPTLATEENQIGFSHNPLALEPGRLYRAEMQFTAADRTLRSRLWADGEALPPLQEIVLDSSYAEFRLNALAVSSYSDEGQDPLYAGSVLAHGLVSELGVTVWHRPVLEVEKSGASLSVKFPTDSGWSYQVESSSDLEEWSDDGGAVLGNGELMEVTPAMEGGHQFFRVRAERPN